MLAQAFAMVAAEHNQRVLIQTLFLQKTQQAAQLLIRKGDFAVIGLSRVFPAVRLRRTIGKMRIIQMHPQEELLLRVLAQPVQRQVGHDVPRTLHLIQVGFFQTAEIKVVVIEIEPPIQSETRVQNGRADHRSGSVSVLLENGSQRWLGGLSLLRLKSCMPLSMG